MKGAVLYGPRDIRYVDRDDPKIIDPTDVILRLSATCVCGSDLWPYRGIDAPRYPAPMGHEYCGVVEEVGRDVTRVKKGQFVIGSFFASDERRAIKTLLIPDGAPARSSSSRDREAGAQ